MRKIVARRLKTLRIEQGGQRNTAAVAAGHTGPWLTHWIKGRQDLTLDEIYVVTQKLGLSLSKIIGARDASDIDWEVFDLMARLKTDQQKQDARAFVAGLAGDAPLFVVERRPSAPAIERLQRVGRKARQ